MIILSSFLIKLTGYNLLKAATQALVAMSGNPKIGMAAMMTGTAVGYKEG